jgi:hypothetical protein
MIKINHNKDKQKGVGMKKTKLQKLSVWCLAILMILTAALAPIPIQATGAGGNDPDAKTTSEYCKSLLGWILCPLLEISGGAADAVYGFIEGQLRINPAILSGGTYTTTTIDDESGNVETNTTTLASAKNVWGIFRDTANVLLVIMFLIVITSYVTGYGINDYNIKKIFPKLVVAVVLINLSFFIVQLAIDVSNLLGSSIKGAFDGMIDSMVMPERTGGQTAGSYGVSTVVSGILLWNANKITPLMSFVFPIIMGIILVAIMVLLLLLIRQAVAILVAVLAPIAFAAMILPNTEKLFNAWKGAFTAVVLTYPVVALLFSGSKLAGSIIIAGSGNNSIMQIMGLALRVIPLVVAPSLIQNTMASVPMVGQAANKLLNRGRAFGMKKAKGSRIVSGQKDRWEKKRDSRLAAGKTLNDYLYQKTGGRFGKAGAQRRQDALEREAKDISSMARSFSVDDLELFKNSTDGKIDKSQLSDSAQFAIMANGGDMSRAFAAAAERSALDANTTTNDYHRMMTHASRAGLSDEQMRQSARKSYANAKASNNLALESRLEEAVRHNNGLPVIESGGLMNPIARQVDDKFLNTRNATDFGRATPESLEQMRQAIHQNYNDPNNPAFKAKIDSVIKGDLASTSPAAAQKLHDIINNTP